MKNNEQEQIFTGKWYAHPPMRHALIADLLTGIAVGLGYLVSNRFQHPYWFRCQVNNWE